MASAPWLLTDNPATDMAGSVSASVGPGGLQAGGSVGGSLLGPSSGKISLFDSKLAEVASWELQHVLPQAWKGPQFDANGKLVALETLELVHEGFLVCLNA